MGVGSLRIDNNVVADDSTSALHDSSDVSNGRIVFSSFHEDADEIYSIHPDGSNLRRLTWNGSERLASHYPVWFPGGHRIIYAVTDPFGRGDNIYVMDVDGSNQRNLTDSHSIDLWYYAKPSADGSEIAFIAKENDALDLYIMDSDGNQITQLTDVGNVYRFWWSPDGTRIAFESGYEGDLEIYMVSGVEQDPPQNLSLNHTEIAGIGSNYDGNAAWSPDGQQIAFVTQRNGDKDIIKLNQGELVYLTSTDADEFSPSWSPNGLEIAYISNASGLPELYIMNADGSHQRQITSGSGIRQTAPVWSPDGTILLFIANCQSIFCSELWAVNPDGTDPRLLVENINIFSIPSWQAVR